MWFFFRLSLISLLMVLSACTGQKPAPLKNSTTPREHVSKACSSVTFEKNVLTKKNILNIFSCSGWSKQYPDLTNALKATNEEKFNQLLQVINDTFFLTKESRKKLFTLMSEAQAEGEIKNLSKALAISLGEYRVLGLIDSAISNPSLDSYERSNLFSIPSSNDEIIKNVAAFKSILKSFETKKPELNNILDQNNHEQITQLVERLIDDSQRLNNEEWAYISKIIFSGDSSIKNWSNGGLVGDLSILQNIILDPNFLQDISYLSSSIEKGIECSNQGHTRSFGVDVGQELKHVIDSLTMDSKENFESVLLHGLTKYVAFQEFCTERETQQGLNSLYVTLKHAFNVIPSSHDYRFLKRIHSIFGSDRYAFLDFLSSTSFVAFRDVLINLKGSDKNIEFVHSLFEILSLLQLDDLKTISSLVSEVSLQNSAAYNWYQSWIKAWNGFSKKQKKDLIQVLSILLKEDIEGSQVVNLGRRLLISFPDFSQKLSLKANNKEIISNLMSVLKSFSKPKVQDELSHFLSNEGLFQFIELLTKTADTDNKSKIKKVIETDELETSYVEEISEPSLSDNRSCFVSLSAAYEKDSNYYGLVNSLPDQCLRSLGSVGFVGQIYIWMNSSNTFFKEHFQVYDFHSATGVWSPGMLNFIFSLAVEAEFSLTSNTGKKGIKNNIDIIYKDLTNVEFLEFFHQFSGLYTTLNNKLQMDARLAKAMERKTDKELNSLLQDTLQVSKQQEPYLKLDFQASDCKKLSGSFGVEPCLASKKVSESFIEILRLLKRKNENNVSLINELISWIHPRGGVPVPFNRSYSTLYKTSIDEIIRFLYDLSSPESYKKFFYHYPDGKIAEVEGSILDRLEVVIRDIAFLNNFYGAYFKNQVASANDYQQAVLSSRKLLVMLDRSSGPLRLFRGLPKESRHRLNNVRNTYSSLIELSNNFEQADGTMKSYGPFIQSLLAAIGSSSKISTQDFNAYRIPEEHIVEGHNGLFLTEVVKVSGLRHLSVFVRNHFDSKLSALEKDDFKSINENLLGRHEIQKLQLRTQSMLEKYLDADRSQLNLMIEDLVEFTSLLSKEEQGLVEEILLKVLIFLSNKNIDEENIDFLGSSFELVVENWPEISSILRSINNKKDLLRLANDKLNGFLHHSQIANRILSELRDSDLINRYEINELLHDENIVRSTSQLLDQLAKIQFQNDLNYQEVFQVLFLNAKWGPVKNWIASSIMGSEKLTLSLLIEFLGEKKGEEIRLKTTIDELLINHRQHLDQFLEESFKSLYLKPTKKIN